MVFSTSTKLCSRSITMFWGWYKSWFLSKSTNSSWLREPDFCCSCLDKSALIRGYCFYLISVWIHSFQTVWKGMSQLFGITRFTIPRLWKRSQTFLFRILGCFFNLIFSLLICPRCCQTHFLIILILFIHILPSNSSSTS